MLCFIVASAALAPAGTAAAAISSSADAGSYVTDGPVHAVAHEPGGNTYIGGDFSHIGPRSGHGVSLTTADPITGSGGDPVWSLGDSAFPEVAGGDVRAVIPDQNGGWFIGGDFTSVAGADVPHLAHILSSGQLDLSWAPRPNDSVLALALDSDTSPSEWTLYAGGKFTEIVSPDIRSNGNRDFLAAWKIAPADSIPLSPGTDDLGDLDSDEPLSWNPGHTAESGGNVVRALDVATLSGVATLDGAVPVVFAGGDFTQIGKSDALTRNRIAAVWGAGARTAADADIEGRVTGWDPNAGAAAGTSVMAIEALDPVASPDNAFLYVPVYFGGATSGGGKVNLAASRVRIDTTTGAVINQYYGWDADPDGAVRALELGDNETLYAGGNFANLGPAVDRQGRSSVAAITAVPVGQLNQNVVCAETACRATVYDWNPSPNGSVRALSASPDGTSVYAGGEFTEIGSGTPEPRNGLAALAGSGEVDEGEALPWDAKPAGGPTNALALAGDSLYAGGGFFSVGAQPRANLAALDPQGALSNGMTVGTSCEPVGSETTCLDKVEALALSPDGQRLFVGGAFTKLGEADQLEDQCHLGALDLVTGQVVAGWKPSPNRAADQSEGDPVDPLDDQRDTGDVMSLDVAGETLYVGGHFDRIGQRTVPSGPQEPCDPPDPGQAARAGIAALDRQDGQAHAWNPNPRRMGPGGPEPFNVYDVEADCESVYAGGSFNEIGAVPPGEDQPIRNAIAELDPATGTATSWNPGDATLDPDPDVHEPGVIRAIAISGGTVYVGGQFPRIGDAAANRAERHNIAALRASDAAATGWNPDANGLVQALAVSGDGQTVFAGGEFFNIGAAARWGLAALQADGVGNATDWDPSARERDPATGEPLRSEVDALAASGDNAYAGGQFTDIGLSAQRGYAQFRSLDPDTMDPIPEPESTDPLFCGPPPPPPPPGSGDTSDTTAPGLGGAFTTDGGQTVVVHLTEPAAIHVDLSGTAPGLRPPGKGRACAPDTPELRAQLQRALRPKLRKLPAKKRARKLKRLIAKRACTVVLPARAFDADGASGPNRVSLAGAGPLAPGSYRAVITARDGAGNQAPPLTIDFEVGP